MLFESLKTPAGQFTTLAKYVEAMPPEQKEIAYIIGDAREQVEHSPLPGDVPRRGWDVLLLTDPIDEFVIPSLPEYKGKKLRAADRGEVEDDKKESKKTETDEKYKKLFEHLKTKLPEVSDVRPSGRLKESAACLVAGEGGASAHLERLMARMGRADEVPANRRILELNGEHPAVVGAARAVREERGRPARRSLRPAAVRTGGDRGGVEGQGPGRVRPADQRAAGEGCAGVTPDAVVWVGRRR